MNWDNRIEVSGNGGKVLVALGELHDLPTWELTKSELEEFAGELIKRVELGPTPSSLLE